MLYTPIERLTDIEHQHFEALAAFHAILSGLAYRLDQIDSERTLAELDAALASFS